MDIFFWSTASLGSLFWIQRVRADINSYHNQVQAVLDTNTASPSTLFKSLQDEKFLSDWKRDPVFPHQFKKEYFVEGVAKCDFPIQTTLKPDAKTVYLINFKDDLYSSSGVRRMALNPKAIRAQEKVSAPLRFTLEKDGKQCIVRRSMEVTALDDVLMHISEKRTLYQLSKSEQILLKIIMTAKGMLRLARKIFANFQGIKVGVSEKEIGIVVGSSLTAYGEVIYDRLQGTLTIERPLYFFSSKANLQTLLMHPLGLKKLKLFFAAFVLVGSGFMLGRALARRVQIWLESYREKQRDPITHLKKISINSYQCKLCNQNLRCIILKPCLHYIACKECAAKAELTRCPECDRKIEEKLEVFIS